MRNLWGTSIRATCLVAAIVGCENPDPFSQPLRTIERRVVEGAMSIPQHSCVTGEFTETAVELEARVDWRYQTEWVTAVGRENGETEEDDPHPFVSIVPLDEAYLAVNSDPSLSVVLDEDFDYQAMWAPTPDPGGDVVSAAVGAGGTVWLLTRSPSRVSGYTSSGDHVWSADLGREGSDIAVASDGAILVAYAIPGPLRGDTTEASVEIVSRISDAGRVRETLISIENGDGSWPRISLPSGPIPVGLRAQRGRLAVFYPYVGLVDIYDEEGSHLDTVSTCVPDVVLSALAAQMAMGREAEAAFNDLRPPPFVSDVAFDPDGTVRIAAPTRTEDGLRSVVTTTLATGDAMTVGFRPMLPPYSGRMGFFGDDPGRLFLFSVEDDLIVFNLQLN